MKQIFSRAIVAVAVRGLGAASAFIFSVLVGRSLGTQGASLYFLSLGIVSIFVVVGKLGLDNVMLRQISSGVGKRDWAQVNGVFWIGMRVGLSTCLGLALFVFAASHLVALKIFDRPELGTPLRLMSLTIFTYGAMTLVSESIKALNKPIASLIIGGFIYAATAALTVTPFVNWFGPAGASLAYLFGTSLAALVGLSTWKAVMRDRQEVKEVAWLPIFAEAKPLWLSAFIRRAILPWSPLLILGFYDTGSDTGIFGAATRVAMLTSIVLSALNSLIAPKLAQLYALGDIQGLKKTSKEFSFVVLVVASPLILILLVGSNWIMGLFGSDFERGAQALSLLVIGQSVNVLCGSVGYVLTMTGHGKDDRNAALIGALVMVIIAALTIPNSPLFGATIATACSVIVVNLYALAMVYYRLGFLLVPSLGRLT